VRAHFGVDVRLNASILIIWLILAGAAIGASTDGAGRVAATGVLVLAALVGWLRSDLRESLAAGLGGAVLTIWLVSGDTLAPGPLVAAGAVILTAVVVIRTRRGTNGIAEADPVSGRQAQPAPAGSRLPPGVADEALFERLAVHEMTRARRYERPLVMLVIGMDGWATLMAERGHGAAHDLLGGLAARVRRLLRDVDAIGVHGNGRLAVLLPETPLDGALVVAGRIQQAAQEDVGVRTRIGAALFPEDAGTVEALVREAEAGVALANIEESAIVQRVCLT
jgi:diguanylate cyclase (GGDEF)-like protein